MKNFNILGRILYSLIFIVASFGHFSQSTIEYARSQGVPLSEIATPVSGVIALLGGLSIAFGYRMKIGALLLIVFLVPVTFMMHNFWAVSDPNMHQMQQIMFMKNISMLGAAIMIASRE